MNKIQAQLLNLKSKSMFAFGIRVTAKTDLPGTLKLIREQAADNRPMMARIIGNDLLTKIENLNPLP